jgi:hypothetical protein
VCSTTRNSLKAYSPLAANFGTVTHHGLCATKGLYTAKIYTRYKTHSFVEQLEAGILMFQFLQNKRNSTNEQISNRFLYREDARANKYFFRRNIIPDQVQKHIHKTICHQNIVKKLVS